MDGVPTLEASSLNGSYLGIPCSQCNRLFSSERSLRCHVKVHNDKVLKCCFCEQMFNRTDTLFLHTLDHISKGTLPCRAEGCDVVVESMSEGEHHAVLKHTGNGITMMKCKDCEESMPTFRKMLYHHTFKHGELKEYADEMTATQKDFLRMKKNQTRKEKKTRIEFKEEVKIKEEIEKREDIEFNKNAFSLKVKEETGDEAVDVEDGILEQLQIAMTGTLESNTAMIGKISDVIAELFPLTIGEQYDCLHCKMGFTDAILWMTHLGYHDVENPFKCSGCGRKFENRQTFVLHLTYYAHGADSKNSN